MQKIIPNLWFDGNAKEAADYYLSIFKDGKIINTTYYPMTEEDGLAEFQKNLAGKILTVEFEILGMNDDVKTENVFFDHLKKYNQISLRNISKEEYDSY